MKNSSDDFFTKNINGLEELVLFSGEYKEHTQRNVPSSLWIFDASNHFYQDWILSNDVGCGMSAFITTPIDYRKAADNICEYLKGKNTLGRNNHFIDICSNLETSDEEYPEYNILIIHSDMKNGETKKPGNIEKAIKIIQKASEKRRKLAYEISCVAGIEKIELLGDWPHNTVEVDKSKIIYRKGLIKTIPAKTHILPAHLGAKILFYTVDGSKIPLPPFSSMPHATGRRGPTGKLKVGAEAVKNITDLVYVPDTINRNSLRSEHPSCYNNHDKLFDEFGRYIVPLGEARILSYVGKI